MKVDIKLVKQLRDMTKAPFKDVKDALEEAWGDLDKAVEILKAKGAAKAAKKADRETKEGIVKVLETDSWVFGVKLWCETDFVAKNDMFLELADVILQKTAWRGEFFGSWEDVPEDLKSELTSLVQEYIGKIGENLKILDLFAISKETSVYVYVHPGNRVVSLVFYKGDEEVAKEVALQVAAMSPSFKDVASIPKQELEDLRAKFKQELADSSKPDDIVEKIVEGKLAKVFEEMVLEEQPYIRDDTQKMKDVMRDKIEVVEFRRFSI